MQDYPFIHCLHPREIINPYTGERLVVACGHCKACLMKKASSYATRCDMERASHKYTLFITLTYSNGFIPRLKVVKGDYNSENDKYSYNLYDLCDRSSTYSEQVGSVLYKEEDMNRLINKVNLDGENNICYALKSDLQKYIKRIRKHVTKYYDNEKIRYYACSEYGPVHFRAHYHLLLFFNSKQLAEDIRQIVCQKWKYGYVDSSFVNSSAASYVAGYVNSNAYLPQIFKISATRTFNTHSFCLGETFYKNAVKEIYTTSTDRVIKTNAALNGRFRDIFMWSTLQTKLFPKCKGYYNKSLDEKFRAYTTYKTAIEFTKTTKLMEQARIIVKEMKNPTTTNSTYLDLLEYFMLSNSDIRLEAYLSGYMDEYESIYAEELANRIYNELRISRNFLRTFCEFDWSYKSIIDGISVVDKFYSDKELINLNNNYRKMEGIDEEYHQYFYDNVYHTPIDETELYKQYNSEIDEQFKKRIKHKKLNDLNNIFLK